MKGQAWTMAAAALVALAMVAPPHVARAEVGDVIRLQGRLLSKGGPVPDGDYGLAVRFYKTDSDKLADAVYTYVSPGVKVASGVFALTLGEALKLDVKAFTTGDAAFVGIQVGSDPELPRLPLHQVPYALRAKVATSVACTGCIGSGQIDSKVLEPFAKSADLHKVATSGKYADLEGGPDLTPFAKSADLHKVATSGKYADLEGGPDLTPFAKAADLHKVATSGKYADLGGKPALVHLTQCPAGQVLSGFKVDGSQLCVADKDSKNTYTGKDFVVSGKMCGAGQVVHGSNADGSLHCVTDKDTKNTYSGKDFALANKTCPGGQVQRGTDANGNILCVADKDTNSTYSGKNFALSNKACPGGQVQRGTDVNGNILCVADKDTNSTYSGKNFALSNKGCASGQVVRGVDVNGNIICIADKDTNSTYDGKNFALSNKSCPTGQVQRGVKSDGTPNCHSGNLNLQNARVYNLATPSATTDAANKAYVDAKVVAAPASIEQSRLYTVVYNISSAAYCPKGWTLESTDTLRGPNQWLYIDINESGLFMGGMNGPNYGNEYNHIGFKRTNAPAYICSQTFTSSSGRPHASVVLKKGGGGCPTGYHYLPRTITDGNNGYTYLQATDAGLYIGYVDSWARDSHGYDETGGWVRRNWTSHVDSACVKIMGVDEDTPTANGVYPVFMGVTSTAACPSDWVKRTTSTTNGSNGYLYLTTVRTASIIGGINDWGWGGGTYDRIQFHYTHVANICWKYYTRTTGRPYYQIRTPHTGNCPAGFISVAAPYLKGWNGNGYIQSTSNSLYLGGLQDWSRQDLGAGWIAHNFTGEVSNKVCLKIQNAK